MKKVVIICPGLQHSHHLAEALYTAGLLEKLVTGIPLKNEGEKIKFPLSFFENKLRPTTINKKLRRNVLSFQIFFKISQKIGNSKFKEDIKHAMYHIFDFFQSMLIKYYKPDIVVCYENAAYLTFKAAKKLSAICILDAATVHHKTQSEFITSPTYGYLNYVRKRKDREIALADRIITCSNFAKDSYLKHGVAPEKLSVVHLGGAKVSENIAGINEEGYRRFVYAGSLRALKSIDILLETFSLLEANNHNCQLYIYGPCDNYEWIKIIKKMKNVYYKGVVPNSHLIKAFSNYDCLILPSRFESFGMVVPEAMSSGIPAIISSKAGASEIVELFPNSGWIVEPSVDSIYKQVLSLNCGDYDKKNISLSAIEASKHFSWENYGKKIINIFQSL